LNPWQTDLTSASSRDYRPQLNNKIVFKINPRSKACMYSASATPQRAPKKHIRTIAVRKLVKKVEQVLPVVECPFEFDFESQEAAMSLGGSSEEACYGY
jgi:hypothetical protein